MTTLYLILFCAVFVGVNALNPVYVKAQRNGACPKSLLLKMLCATGYLVTCVLAMLIGNNFTKFSWLILLALGLSWIGDLFLHLWQHKVFHGIGFLGFLSAHFIFIWAYLTEIKAPDGYNLLDHRVKITVSADGTVRALSDVEGTATSYKVEGPNENGVITITIPNNPGVELPHTGGPGTVVYTVAGAMMITAGVLLFIARRRHLI